MRNRVYIMWIVYESFQIETCAMGEMKWDFFTGMHISRTKLYSDSVHLYLCNKYVYFLDRGFWCGYIIHSWHCCSPSERGVGVEVSDAIQSITGAFFFSSSLHRCVIRDRGGGHTAAVTAPHNRAKVQRRHLLVVLKSIQWWTVLFLILHLECLIFMPVFIMFHLTY